MQIALQTFIHKVDPSLSLPFVLLYSFLFLLVAGGLVAYLDRADYNDNINIKKNIL